jgi:hypothetical protein
MDEEAQGQMEFYLRGEPPDSILESETAKESWDLLCERYHEGQGRGKQRIIEIVNEVFHTEFTDTEPLESQLNRFTSQISLINRLKGQKAFDDEFTAMAIINALPESLESLKTVLANNPVLTTRDVKLRIINDERRRITKSGSRNAAAYYAKVNKGKCSDKDKDKGKSDKKRCAHCNFWGHDISECRKLKKEREKEDDKKADATPKSKSKKVSAKIAVADDNGSDNSDTKPIRLYNVSDRRDANLRNDWIMDSGAMRSMSSNREWFSHYTPFKLRRVLRSRMAERGICLPP